MLEIFRSLTAGLMLIGMAVYMSGWGVMILDLSFKPSWINKLWQYANHAGKVLRGLGVVMISVSVVSVILIAISGEFSWLWVRYWLIEAPAMLMFATFPIWPELIEKILNRKKNPGILPVLTE